MRTTILPASALLALTAGAAHALDASKTLDVKAPPAKVWAEIGDFCRHRPMAPGDRQMHPVGGRQENPAHAGPERRRPDRGTPTLPQREEDVVHLRHRQRPASGGSLQIHDRSDEEWRCGSTVTWSGTFTAKGATDAKAEAAVQGIYDSGLDALAAKVQ